MASIPVTVVGLVALLAVAVPFVQAVRHPNEKPLAAYLVFVVSFSATASLTFLTLVQLAQRWPVAADEILVLSPGGIIVFSVVAAFLVGLWLASRAPGEHPSI